MLYIPYLSRRKFLVGAAALAAFSSLGEREARAATLLDGNGNSSTSGSPNNPANTTAVSALLTTAGSGTVNAVYYADANGGNTGHAPALTSMAAIGLTFTKRWAFSSGTTFHGQMELWSAPSAGAIAAKRITATASGNFDNGALIVWGVSGTNATPFDSNISLPNVSTWTQSPVLNDPPAMTQSTTNANNFIIFAVGSDHATTFTNPTGFTTIDTVQNGVGSLWAYMQIAYKIVTAIQSSTTFTWGNTLTATSSGIAAVDALTSDGPPVTLYPNRMLTGIF